MSAVGTSGIAGKGSFARGVHPDGKKQLASEAAVEVLPTPESVLIALQQHIGAPCEAVVKSRAEVAIGEIVGNAQAFVAAPVHASVDGTAGAVTATTLPNGRHVQAVPIAAAAEQSLIARALWDDTYGGDWPTTGLDAHAPDQIVQAVRDAGLVGMGGAAFPTHVKLKSNPQRPLEALLVNGCECEPYLTADYRLMVEAPEPIVTGALIAARAAGAERVIVVIEDNKPRAVERMRAAAGGTGIEVAAVRTQYPMGGERQLIPAVMDMEVPTGALPLDVGVVVINVATAAAVARAVVRKKPLTHRIICVTGEGVVTPKNLLAPVGASYAELIACCGGLAADAARVISGGPMMGFALGDLDVPVTKGASGVVVLTAGQVRKAEETACVRCGRCVDVCPLNLVPTRIALAARASDWDLARRYHITACCECGCCAYTCPASIPLVQLIRVGKATMPKAES